MSILIFAIVVAGAYSFFKSAKGVLGLPFGGKVMTAIPCTCSGNFLLTVSPPKGGQFVYYLGTQAYLSYNLPSTGVWALGLYTPGGICMMYAGVGCSPFGAPIGTVTQTVGTSVAF